MMPNIGPSPSGDVNEGGIDVGKSLRCGPDQLCGVDLKCGKNADDEAGEHGGEQNVAARI